MKQSRLVKISKYLSYHLRHHPEQLGLILAPGGWVEVEKLLSAAKKNNFLISFNELQQVVVQNDKQRFSLDATGTLIRANQGHSSQVDLQLKPITPPSLLYQGTHEGAVSAIEREGLRKMSRHHVHLSEDLNTARNVGARRGKPIIFQIDALAMSQANYQFYCSANGVWLVDAVPSEYLRKLEL
ncbi:phosphotransferase KptA/Tpt1 [Stanieria sp. NIES-3757]|nr:phosphotransferase KptA/Tpt1 [Stanieria sp. NIES-3757]